MIKRISLIILFALSFSNMLYAKDLGTYGHTFKIAEENMIDWIYKRLNYLEKTGQLDQLKDRAIHDVKASALRPKPVNLITTTSPKSFYYTPTFTLQSDIKDAQGHILYFKGTTVNPLDVTTYPLQIRKYYQKAPIYNKTWIFFNGDDTQQINWLKKKIKSLNDNKRLFKLIMTGGDIKETSDQLKTKVYFDQYGKLTKKIGLLHVPSVMDQEKTHFKITEINVSRESSKLSAIEGGFND
ncbi:type-F conjugative transfer system protein TraW [Thiotrichales bacterium 19S11-10]|nr:type-F conjugative transfer system protein TraW [Thiotrichales bacterium 19S11-10]